MGAITVVRINPSADPEAFLALAGEYLKRPSVAEPAPISDRGRGAGDHSAAAVATDISAPSSGCN